MPGAVQAQHLAVLVDDALLGGIAAILAQQTGGAVINEAPGAGDGRGHGASGDAALAPQRHPVSPMMGQGQIDAAMTGGQVWGYRNRIAPLFQVIADAAEQAVVRR